MFTTRTHKNTSTTMTYSGKRPSAKAEATSRTFTEDPFRARFGHRLPAACARRRAAWTGARS